MNRGSFLPPPELYQSAFGLPFLLIPVVVNCRNKRRMFSAPNFGSAYHPTAIKFKSCCNTSDALVFVTTYVLKTVGFPDNWLVRIKLG